MYKKFSIPLIILLILLLFSRLTLAGKRLTVFAGSASKPPTEEAIRLFEKKRGVKVYATFGGSGYVLSQMILSRMGDIYFPGSSDYMEKAKKEGYVYEDTERIIVYLVPAINVQRGNPENIKDLKDMLRPGLRIAIANPDGVCVGAYAVEIVEKSLTPTEKRAFRKNLVNYTASCTRTATAISLRMVDAVMGWRVFEYWDPERIKTVPLRKEEIIRIGYIPIAVSRYTHNKKLAQEFINFMLSSSEVKDIFRKYHYFMTPEEAFEWIGAEKPIGGVYVVPDEWIHE